MFVEPVVIDEIIASPFVPVILLMVATDVFDETQATDAVKSCRLPLVKVPIAVNCCVVLPEEIEIAAEAGDTVIEASAAGVIISVALLEVIPEKLAVMAVAPCPTDVDSPFVPEVLLMVATPGCDEFQVTDEVISGLLPSE
jgi:hypothetical protein